MNPARKRAYLELLIVAAIWGMAAPIIKFTLGGFSPEIFATYRFFISAMVAFVIFAFTGIKFPKNPKALLGTLFNGFLLTTVAIGLLFLGLNKTTSVDSNLISAMSPIIIAACGVIFLNERVTKRESIGMLLALTGTVITIIEPVLELKNGFSGMEGNLLVLISVVVGAVTAILAKKLLRNNVDAGFATNSSFIMGFITMLPIALALNPGKNLITEIASTPFKYHLGVLYMAMLSGSLAYYLWHKAEKTIEIGEVNLIGYLYPLFGAPLSILWLKESIDLPFIIGGVLIIAGVALAQIKKKRYT